MEFFYIVAEAGADEWFEATETVRLDLLRLMGAEYMIDHCLLALKKKGEDVSWKNYMADGVMAIAGNTAKHMGWSGMVESGRIMTERWAGERTHEERKEEVKREDDRDCKDIVADIWKRMRGKK